jgi:hypothetical protein
MTAAQLTALAERDGWSCWLCDGPIDPSLPRTLPGAASIDHVVPRSRGGTSDLRNLRLAHRRCNTRRGSTLPELDWPARFCAIDAAPLWAVAVRAGRRRRPEVVAVLPTRELAEEAATWAVDRLTRFLGGTWTAGVDRVGTSTDTCAVRVSVTGELDVPDVGRPRNGGRDGAGRSGGRRRR